MTTNDHVKVSKMLVVQYELKRDYKINLFHSLFVETRLNVS